MDVCDEVFADFGRSMMAKAALELYSIRELMEKDVPEALAHTAEAGYDGVEFAGFFGMPSQKIKDKLDELGLETCGSHTGWDLLTGNIKEVFEYNAVLKNKNIILPYISEEYRKSAEGWADTARKFNEIGQKCRDAGFNFAYHNHSFEFEKFDTVSGYEILAENVDPRYVKLQPDLGWVAFAGENVGNFLETYKDLIINIHVKQFKKAGSHEATEVHKGMVNYPPIIKKCIGLGIEWFIIEQEGFDIPMLQSIKENCTELKKMF
jgi:sugar phosphate isomerase/epimerase